MAVTIKDIAERTGYTIATVSRALNSSDLVRQKTKEKIIRVAQEMGYIRNEVARGLATRQMPAVGIIIPDITNPYFPALVKGIQDTLVKAGYNTVLCNSDSLRENEMMHMKMLCEFRVKGIIMDPLSDDTYENVRENSAGMPIVFASNRPAGEDVNFVIIDNYNGAVKSYKISNWPWTQAYSICWST
ncbi:MAG: LacI family DNA-binding transcriptional regulator [Acetivibrionales bacterium]